MAVLTLLVLRRLILYFLSCLLCFLNFMRRSLIAVISRWWSDGISAPLITLTFYHALLNWFMYADVVDLVFCYVVSWSPCRLVKGHASSYCKLVKRAQISKSFTILIHVAQSLSTHDFIVASVVGSNFGNEIAHKCRHVFLPCFIKDCLKLLVEGLFHLIISVVGGGVALDDVRFDLPFLFAELCCYYSGINRFSSNKSSLCLQG